MFKMRNKSLNKLFFYKQIDMSLTKERNIILFYVSKYDWCNSWCKNVNAFARTNLKRVLSYLQ